MKITSKTYFIRHENEINRFITSSANWVHIINLNNAFQKFTKHENNLFRINIDEDLSNQIEPLKNDKFDLIVLTDIFEVTKDVYGFLRLLDNILDKNGKILINSVNPKWNLLLLIFEFLNFKQNSPARSYIHHKKIYSIAESCGFILTRSFTRQLFPFRLFRIGNFINNFLEVLFFRFNLGINNYIVLTKKTKNLELQSKSIIVPAKNEEKNLLPLIKRIPKFDSPFEILMVIGKSNDNTLNEALRIKKDFPELDINVIEQISNGKGPGVLEAIDIAKYELITILDSDISVDPETLVDFFRIVEEGHADFINGTRFIYKMEKGAMRKLNNFGNLFFQFIISIVINNKLTDSLCGTKVFKKSSIDNLLKWQHRLIAKDPFGDFDFLFSAAYSGAQILEYPVHYKARSYGSTQISRFSDGVKLLLYFINSFIVFNSSKNDVK